MAGGSAVAVTCLHSRNLFAHESSCMSQAVCVQHSQIKLSYKLNTAQTSWPAFFNSQSALMYSGSYVRQYADGCGILQNGYQCSCPVSAHPWVQQTCV